MVRERIQKLAKRMFGTIIFARLCGFIEATMVKIRLARFGKKKQASYRIVAADSRAKRNGRFLEVLGFYNPKADPFVLTLKKDRIKHWLSVGAKPTGTVARLLRRDEEFKDVAGGLSQAISKD
jgi:small subunit ribosomal protein S16